MSAQTLVLSTTTSTVGHASSVPSDDIDRRRCWECQRRRLVCDATRPVCSKCRIAGIVCPGYEDKKPLVWLTPGKVTCRRPKTTKGRENGKKSPSKQKKPKDESKNVFGVDCIYSSPLRTDVCDVYDAVQYYNLVFYPYTSSGHKENASNVFVDKIPLNIVRFFPTAIAHNLVSIVFQHRMCVQKQWKMDCPSVKHAQARLHHHRGIAIRALNEDIANEKTQSSDVVLTGVILLLNSEIQSCITPNWRQHVKGLLAMLECRGGASGWMRDQPILKGILLSFLICATMANTTSPPFDHVRIAAHEELLDLVRDVYPLGLHPSIPCPMPLFLEIIQINHIRNEVSSGFLGKQAARAAADAIIARIEAFDAKEWTGFYEVDGYNDMVGLIYQSSVAVFCISSLQSVSVLPNSHRLTVLRTVHSNRLYHLLGESKKVPVVQKSLQWPLVVAGVEAADRVDKRQIVGELLESHSTDVGTPLPMHAKGVIRTFWDSDETSWDACFDQPYAFVA